MAPAGGQSPDRTGIESPLGQIGRKRDGHESVRNPLRDVEHAQGEQSDQRSFAEIEPDDVAPAIQSSVP